MSICLLVSYLWHLVKRAFVHKGLIGIGTPLGHRCPRQQRDQDRTFTMVRGKLSVIIEHGRGNG